MTSPLKFLLPIGLALGSACTAGDVIVPENDAGGSSGASSVLPGGGSAGSTSTTAGSTSTPSGGSGVMMGGSGGSGPSGGTGGTGVTAGGSGGTGGTGEMPEDLNAAVAVWNGWRVDMLCNNDPGKTFLSETCQLAGGDICNMVDDNSGRTMFTIEKTMAGDPNKVYKFRVRVRGVLEPKAFDPGSCPPLFEGPNVPMRACKCNDPECLPLESGFNWMQLNIESPKQRYYMNNAKDSVSHRVEVIDGEFDIEARGGTKITYFFDNLNTGQIRNCENKLAPDLDFVPGNFFVFDVIPGSITATEMPE